MRVAPWFLGGVIGLIAGAVALAAGVFAFVLVVPAMAWAATEKARPLGLGGLLIGLGAGSAGLMALAGARCAASNVSGPNYFSACQAPDLTPFLVPAAVLAVAGVGVSLIGMARREPRPA